MSHLARSTTWPRIAALGLAIALIASACGDDDDAGSSAAPADTATDAGTESADGNAFSPGTLDSGATIERFDADGVTVHTYTNDPAGFGNTTAIIESDNVVVLIDAHFGEGPASEFRDFAESFGKPIEQLLVTHDHPDHIGGIESVFSDVDTASSEGVVDAAAAAGTTIKTVVEAGTTEIDGVTYQFDVFVDAEAEEQLVITLPDHGVLVAGDLAYSGYHAVMSPTFDNWLSILDTLAATEGLQVVIPGHGAPGGPEVIDDSVDYLTTAQATFAESDDAESFNAAMVEAYPDRLGANLLEFGSGRLFP